MDSLSLIPIVKCPVCCHPQSTLISDKVSTINPYCATAIELRECKACGHWWNTPTPHQSDLLLLYQESSLFVVSENWDTTVINDRPMSLFEKMILLSGLEFEKLKYLEIGCGDCFLFKQMERKCLEAYGIEPGDCMISDHIKKDLSQIPSSIMFDVIVFQNVIEHVVDPLLTMETYSAKANRGAHVFAAFPNKDSFIAKRKKDKWDMMRPFGHLHYFSRRSLNLLFEKTGWKIIDLQRGPNRFPLASLQTYNLFKTLKRIVSNDQWYLMAEKV